MELNGLAHKTQLVLIPSHVPHITLMINTSKLNIVLQKQLSMKTYSLLNTLNILYITLILIKWSKIRL